jgi:hypothetical protein
MFGYLQPSADRTEDGVEVWDLLEDSGFSETVPAAGRRSTACRSSERDILPDLACDGTHVQMG